MLVKSVKKEVQQREALEIANREIKKKSDQLEVANEKLKQLDRAKTDFINFASHQLRTPITSIKGFSSLLTEGSYGELAPEQKEAVKKIEIVTGRMASLVEDFLSASRIDSGTMKYEFEKCKIEDICQEVATTLFPKANSNKLYLKYEKPIAAMPELLIDGSKTRETISNLVDNAIKYTKEGGVTISLELAENQQLKTNDKRVVRIIVSDTGIGIPKDELAHLFAKFSRGLDIKRLTATGTGLGLFVGKSMIEKQGGKVWAESEGEGKGSRFIVELPVELAKKSREILGVGEKV
jgi:signal transduction histidine kinase